MIETFMFKMMLREYFRAGRILAWVAVGFVVGLMSFAYVRLNPSGNSDLAYPTLSSILVFRVLALSGAIFSASVIAQEVEQKTIVYLLTRPISRAKLLIARILACATMTAAITFLSALAVSAAVYGPRFLANEYLWRDVPAILIGAVVYSGIFVLVSLIVNKSMIINLLYAFAWETSIPNMPGSMYLLSVASYLQVIAERPSVPSTNALTLLSGGLGNNTLTGPQAWLAMTIVAGATIAMGMWWFTKFEFTPREDGE